MAELHKFQDDAKTADDRVKPIVARHIDENFKTVRLELDELLKAVFEIEENPGVADKLKLKTGHPSNAVLGISAGVVLWIDTDECE
jgi:hypothetical protein